MFRKSVPIKGGRWSDWTDITYLVVFLWYRVFRNTKNDDPQRQTFRPTHECFFYAARARKDRDPDLFLRSCRQTRYVNRWDDDDHVNQLTLPDRQRGQLLVILFLISFLFCVRYCRAHKRIDLRRSRTAHLCGRPMAYMVPL